MQVLTTNIANQNKGIMVSTLQKNLQKTQTFTKYYVQNAFTTSTTILIHSFVFKMKLKVIIKIDMQLKRTRSKIGSP
jgi:uncharacterized protein YwbE